MIIPFFIPHSGCPHQCVFCNQKNITGHRGQPDPLLLPDTINQYLNTAREGSKVQIAFYGGSFTALPPETQIAYLEAAAPFVRSGRVERIRLSTRPDAVFAEGLKLLARYDVKTIELGAQSMNDTVLRLSRRGHTSADTISAVRLLKKHKFEIGLQLMPGLPGDSKDAFMESVRKIIALGPDFVRIYPALVIKDTPLADLFKSGEYAPLSLDEAVALSKEGLLRLEAAGIKVIRLGLQPSEELEKPGTVIAGPFHPAFRQLVESSIMLDKMTAALEDSESTALTIKFLVHPSDHSTAAGQKRSNLKKLKAKFGLNDILLQPDNSVGKSTIKIAV